jgi:hypothetical protein
MASGRPDYTSQSLIKGSDAGIHRTVAVDPAGNLLTLIKGQFGGAPVTIAVDAGGNILGILQGDYAGTLKTLAVDDKGRMLAVLTDPEDVFGNPHYMGSAELAARLGSPSCLDRRGQVLFMDPGGVNNAQYSITLTGANSSVDECGTAGPLGGLCYKCVAGPAAADGPAIGKYLPIVTESGHAIECVCALDANAAYWTLGLVFKNWNYTKTGYIRYDVANLKMQYWTSASVWADIAGLTVYPLNTSPHFMKLVINPTTGKYIRAIFDNNVYDLSAYSLQAPLATGATYILASVSIARGSVADATSYLSNIIVTCNEV